MLQILTLVFAFILKAWFDFIYIKLAAHALRVELSFTSFRGVGRGVFICPLLETRRKYYSTVSTVLRAHTYPPPTEDQLHHGFSSYTPAGFCLMYSVNINFILLYIGCTLRKRRGPINLT